MADTHPTATGYGAPAVLLHWAVAALIISGFALGEYMVTLAFSPSKLRLFAYHKWIGVSVLMLAAARLAWRASRASPGPPPGMADWEWRAARAAHLLLYALMFVVPLSGWLMSSAHGFQTVYLGVLPIPDLLAKDKALAEALETVHYILTRGLAALFALHVLAALKHHFMDRDDVLRRMLRLTGLIAPVLMAPALVASAAWAAPIDKAASRVEFVSRQMGVPIKGAFARFEAQIHFDPDDTAGSRASISIDLDSIDAGSDDATFEIKRRPWFDVKNHPKAEFVSSSLKELGPGRYRVSGPMTIKGRTRQVFAPLSARREGGSWVFEGSFTLNRLDFAIGEGAWSDIGTVAAEVEVRFRLKTARPK